MMRKCPVWIICGALVLTAVLPGFAQPVYAAAPRVDVDEAAYVNLDYYGGLQDVSVVKGCAMNGLTEFTDYGTYESVENMSTYDEPKLSGAGVQWTFKKPLEKRFYYSCNLGLDQLILPWSFDISYKLNGVPKKAEELIGAEGLVEINIHAIPNPKATEYFRNNMLLSAALYVNMEDTLSFEAEGAQLQSLGTYKGAMFLGLPGEDMTYTVRIGTTDFESSGVTMMMIPGTAEQLEKIADLKETKDTVKDSADAIYDSINALCLTLESMDSGLAAMSEGVSGLEGVHQNVSEQRESLEEERQESLEQLEVLAKDLDLLIPELKNAEEMTELLLDKTEGLLKTLGSLRKDFDYLADDMESLQDAMEILEDDLEAYKKDIANMMTALAQMYNSMQGPKGLDPGTGMPVYWDPATQDRGFFGNLTLKQLQTMMDSASKRKGADRVMSSLKSACDTLEDLSKSMMKVASASTQMGNAIGTYHEDIVSVVTSSKQLVTDSSGVMHSLIQNLTSMNNILKENGEPFDRSLTQSAQGMIQVLDQCRSGLKNISLIRTANSTVKDAVDRQISEFEDENNFLNLDAGADKISLTSPKNPEPSSVQIILRSAELTHESTDDNIVDLEQEPEDEGFWARLCAIFVQIKEKLMG